MSSLTLPGLCTPESVKDRLSGLSAAAAFVTVARHLFDVAQLVQTDATGAFDQTKRSDPRFGPALLLSCALQFGINDVSLRRAWRRSADLAHALKTFGSAGCAGKVAEAALRLARSVQILDREALAPIIDLLAEAATLRADELKVAPEAYTAGVQLTFLRYLNA